MTPRPSLIETAQTHLANDQSSMWPPERNGGQAILAAPPGKKPLIRLSAQPHNYESRVSYLRTAITSNDAFFIRYNLPDIPRIDAKAGG